MHVHVCMCVYCILYMYGLYHSGKEERPWPITLVKTKINQSLTIRHTDLSIDQPKSLVQGHDDQNLISTSVLLW